MQNVTQSNRDSIEDLEVDHELSPGALTELLMDIPRKAQYVSFEAETSPRMRKTVNGVGTPYNEFHDDEGNCLITKVARIHGMVNFQYENSVNNQRQREQGIDHEPFEAGPRPWGERIDGTPLVEHKGRHYIEVMVVNPMEVTYLNQDGNVIPREDLEPYLSESKQPSTQKTDKEVVLRDYRITNLNEITFQRSTHSIV